MGLFCVTLKPSFFAIFESNSVFALKILNFVDWSLIRAFQPLKQRKHESIGWNQKTKYLEYKFTLLEMKYEQNVCFIFGNTCMSTSLKFFSLLSSKELRNFLVPNFKSVFSSLVMIERYPGEGTFSFLSQKEAK